MPSPALTATVDQLHAATREAQKTLNQGGGNTGETVTTPAHPSPWLADQVRALVTALVTRRGALCPHIGTSPRVAHAAVWAPGVITCPDCRHLLDPGPLEDTTCDRCRTLVPELIPCLAAVGPVLLAFGLCHSCADIIDHPNPRKPRP